MAGGTFDSNVNKTRPGTYINVKSTKTEAVGTAARGVVVIPLINHNYGPCGEFIKLTNAAPDKEMAKLGYSVYSPEMLLIKEAFKKANTVYAYILAGNEKKATATGGGVTAEAKYAGTRGNDFKYSVAANPAGGFDVKVYAKAELLSEYKGLNDITELVNANDPYITFTAGEGAVLSDVASVSLTGGTDTAATTGAHTAFLDGLEAISFNALAYPVTGDDAESLKAAAKTKLEYLNESVGKRIHAAIPDFAADCQFVINVTNGVVLTDGTKVDNAAACAYVAALYAGTSDTESNTYAVYDGAVSIENPKTSEAAEVAIKNGEFFFSYSEEGKVVVEYDINSLVTYRDGVDSSYSKNRVQRVIDEHCSWLKANFPPNKFDNNEEGWGLIEGIGRAKLVEDEKRGAIKNVDAATDFVVDRTKSEGDRVYINEYIQPVDSAEKIFISAWTN